MLTELVRRCYGAEALVEFEHDRTASLLAAALAFGAYAARVLRPHEPAGDVELLCGVFNAGIGLVDHLCDDDAETGAALLELVRRHDLVDVSAEPRERGWLGGTLTAALAADDTVAFTVVVIETFFETLHEVYPGEEWLERRRAVGRQLEAALDAELRTVAGDEGSPEELIACSRLTSVLPFEIVETLVGRDGGGAGTRLGEAMWRIDDLVDLADDARTGALNGVLLSGADPSAVAAEAAGSLERGLELAGGDRRGFLSFIQRYAGVDPSPATITASSSASSTGRTPSGGM